MPTPSALPPRATPLNPRKYAMVVGASSGVGAALARRLAAENYTLALLARRTNLLSDLCDGINRQAGERRALYYTHDVADYAAVPALLQKSLADLGGLDVFVYDAGILLPVEREEFDIQKDRRMTEVNYLGALAWLNPVAALFQNLGTGTIVGIGSVAGDRGRVGAPAYNASKAALHTYLEALRNRLTGRGVHVLTVKPGFVATDMLQYSPRTFWVTSTEQVAEKICSAIHTRRQIIYIPSRWGLVMGVIRLIPSFIFRRLSF